MITWQQRIHMLQDLDEILVVYSLIILPKLISPLLHTHNDWIRLNIGALKTVRVPELSHNPLLIYVVSN